MIDFDAVVGFEWDEGNARKSVDKHGVTQREAEEAFFCKSLWIVPDAMHSSAENRFHAFGISAEGRRLHISFTLRDRGTLIRVISARDMSRQEKRRYEASSTEDQ